MRRAKYLDATALTPSIIMLTVADFYGTTVTKLLEHDQHRALTRPRQVAMALCRGMLGMSYPQIGKAFDRDHTTVLYAVEQVTLKCEADAVLLDQMGSLKDTLERAAATRAAAHPPGPRTQHAPSPDYSTSDA
jgi:chromosomal replication initiator protein